MCGDTDEVLGVVDLRELLWRYQKTGRFSLEASVVPVPMVFEHTGLPDVLDASGSDGHCSGRIRERRGRCDAYGHLVRHRRAYGGCGPRA